jgi:hypothetical protein
MTELGRVALVAVVVAVLTAACATVRTTGATEEYQVTGYVHAGPVCPVERHPPDPACADRPVAGAVLVVVDDQGRDVADIRTDPEGEFDVLLPAGSYTLVPQPVEGLLGTASPMDFAVGPDVSTELDVAYGTGIR